MSLDHICDSAVADSKNTTSVASRGVSEGTGYTKILQVSDLLLNDINTTTNVTGPAFNDYLGLHRLLLLLLLLLGHATL